MSLRTLQFFLCQLGEIHHQEVRQDLYKLLFEQNLEMQNQDFFLFKNDLTSDEKNILSSEKYSCVCSCENISSNGMINHLPSREI